LATDFYVLEFLIKRMEIFSKEREREREQILKAFETENS
jgi:hypothetical protein